MQHQTENGNDVPGTKLVSDEVASVILSGIMLDTGGFTRNTGSRTLDAARYLYGKGANAEYVHSFFNENYEDYERERSFSGNMLLHDGTVGLTWSHGTGNGAEDRVAAAKEADKLLNIKGISASFALVVVDNAVRISGLTSDEAKQELLQSLEDEVKHDSAMMVKELEQQAKDDADRKAREIISLAIQRCAADHVAETTVSVVGLPNDEMKGRIIGREGRNIRTLETLTGIDLIIDDTPEAVIISGFDPVRREVARIALEKLINDGRIHPSRIEEMVEKAQKEVEQKIKEAGEQATFAVGVHGLHPELIKLLGRLKYRTSYGQNVLNHSVEVANLAGVMASELGVDVVLAKRAGLLHDIGKAIDHEMEGSHVEIGGEIAKKFRESELVINAVLAHHGDCEPKSVEAVLVSAADAVSAARPGARRETLESYLKRLTRLEEISESFDGVEKCYAVQAGREIRIMVKPDVIDDASAVLLARDISKKIEAEMEYPGQIKVVIIRETRAVDYAK